MAVYQVGLLVAALANHANNSYPTPVLWRHWAWDTLFEHGTFNPISLSGQDEPTESPSEEVPPPPPTSVAWVERSGGFVHRCFWFSRSLKDVKKVWILWPVYFWKLVIVFTLDLKASNMHFMECKVLGISNCLKPFQFLLLESYLVSSCGVVQRLCFCSILSPGIRATTTQAQALAVERMSRTWRYILDYFHTEKVWEKPFMPNKPAGRLASWKWLKGGS